MQVTGEMRRILVLIEFSTSSHEFSISPDIEHKVENPAANLNLIHKINIIFFIQERRKSPKIFVKFKFFMFFPLLNQLVKKFRSNNTKRPSNIFQQFFVIKFLFSKSLKIFFISNIDFYQIILFICQTIFFNDIRFENKKN